MTTVQLLQRIARRARTTDMTQLSMPEQGDVLEAANAANQRLYAALPSYFKELPEGFVLPAPVTVSVPVTQNSALIGSNVFGVDQIGRTVVLSGDPGWNVILDVNRLLNPYIGATGTVSGTVYGDAVYSTRYPIERVIDDPRFANQSMGPLMMNRLARVNNWTDWWFLQQIGMPRRWWVMALGNSQGNEPLFVLKVAPVPDQAYAINVRINYWPKRLTLSDISSATPIVCPDQFIEKCLIPMGHAALLGTPAWQSRSPEDDKRVIAAGIDAEADARNQAGRVAVPNNSVGTPVGW